jgi:hypothetical protein
MPSRLALGAGQLATQFPRAPADMDRSASAVASIRSWSASVDPVARVGSTERSLGSGACYSQSYRRRRPAALYIVSSAINESGGLSDRVAKCTNNSWAKCSVYIGRPGWFRAIEAGGSTRTWSGSGPLVWQGRPIPYHSCDQPPDVAGAGRQNSPVTATHSCSILKERQAWSGGLPLRACAQLGCAAVGWRGW